jgi:uncharacterized protein YkwD
MKTQITSAFVAALALMALTVSCSKEPVDSIEIVVSENVQDIELELINAVNEFRKSNGHSALEFNEVAYELANEHTDYMIARGALNHDGFSARASEISAQVNAQAVAENVARDFPTALDAFNGWLRSDGHRKNMEGDFSHTAVSVKISPSGQLYFTQIFFLK